MGARIHFAFKGEGELYTVLYSHWGETNWREDLAIALNNAKPRWDDSSYATRIVISQLIGENWNSETGFGIYSVNDIDNVYTSGDAVVALDMENQIVYDDGNGHSFSSFVEYQQEVKEYHNV